MKNMFRFAALPALTLMSACSWLYPTVPKIDSRMVSAPTVTDIVDRVTCELAYSLRKNGAFGPDPHVAPGSTNPQWTNLVLFKATASVHLDLEIDVTRGLDPSVTYSDPIGAAMGAAGQQSWSLAVSGQFNGTVTRHITIDFFLDMPALSEYTKFPCAGKSGLAGDLQLEEALSTGLSALNQSSVFNLYAPPGSQTQQQLDDLQGVSQSLLQAVPAAPIEQKRNLLQDELKILRSLNPQKLAVNPRAPYVLRGAESSVNAYASQLDQVRQAPGSSESERATATRELRGPANESLNLLAELKTQAGKGGAQKTGSANTSFGTEVDFTIVRNIGGGPGLNRTHWKIAGAGGGGSGGGGGGGAGGGGASGGASGGGGGNMLNYNRSMVDSLIIQVAPTCIDDSTYPKPNPTNFWQTLGNCAEESVGDTRSLLEFKTYQLPFLYRRP